jgi:vesicular inhibitory amino acid transporter
MILIGDSLKALFPNVDLVHLKLIAFVIITPLSWMPINLLSHVSILGIVSTLSLTAVIIIDGFKPEPPGSFLKPIDTYLFPPNWMALPLAFGLINAGFTGHAIFPSLYRDMAKPGSYNKMVNNSYLITSVVYITVAVCGYLMFGSETLAEVSKLLLFFLAQKILLSNCKRYNRSR